MTDEELNERLNNIDQALTGLATQLNTMTIRASVVAFGQPNQSGGFNPDGMPGLLEAIKGTAAYSLIPAGQAQTTANAIIDKSDNWDYATGRKVTITCAAWGVNQQRTIVKVIKSGEYATLYFNTPIGLPLAAGDKILPLPW